MDFAGGRAAVQRVEVQPGGARFEQLGAELGGGGDADTAHLVGIVDAFQALEQPLGNAACRSSVPCGRRS